MTNRLNKLYQEKRLLKKQMLWICLWMAASYALAQNLDSAWISTNEGCKIYNPNPIDNESVTWSGECKDGFANGKGKMIWKVDELLDFEYHGEMQRGIYHGPGRYWSYEKGELDYYMEGTFDRRILNGIGKEIVFDEGDTLFVYAGYFSDDVFERGTKEYHNNEGGISVYKGNFEDYTLKGLGEYWHYESGEEGLYYKGPFPLLSSEGEGIIRRGYNVYEGWIKKGDEQGKGVMTYKGTLIYEGDWKGGEYHGIGHRVYPNGSRYMGEYKNGRCQGFGIFRWPDGMEYVGKFDRGLFHGMGFIRDQQQIIKVAGVWENGKLFQKRPVKTTSESLKKKYKDLFEFYQLSILKKVD